MGVTAPSSGVSRSVSAAAASSSLNSSILPDGVSSGCASGSCRQSASATNGSARSARQASPSSSSRSNVGNPVLRSRSPSYRRRIHSPSVRPSVNAFSISQRFASSTHVFQAPRRSKRAPSSPVLTAMRRPQVSASIALSCSMRNKSGSTMSA